jgi:hypothetical protein
MVRLKLTAEEVDAIAARIAAYDVESDPPRRWYTRFVEQFGVLPLYHGWSESIGIRADAVLVRWSTEGEYEGTREVDAPIWVRIALVEGAKRYPVLRPHIPPRPAGALTCQTCHGTGSIQQLPTVICQCGGVGWIDEHTPK